MPLEYKIVTVIAYIGDKNKIFEIQKCQLENVIKNTQEKVISFYVCVILKIQRNTIPFVTVNKLGKFSNILL